MESWRVAIISVCFTLVVIIMIFLAIGIAQSGIIRAIKDVMIEDYCNNIPLTEARELEACNELQR